MRFVKFYFSLSPCRFCTLLLYIFFVYFSCTIVSAYAAQLFVQPVLKVSADSQQTMVADQSLNPDQLQLYHRLLKELRCPRCEGQSIAESNSPVAKGMSNQVYALIASGKNKEEIKAYLVTRYGESILFQPGFSWKNLILWLAPGLLGVILFIWFAKRYIVTK